MQCPGLRIHPSQEFKINAETTKLVGRMLGIGDYTTGRISAKTCPEVQQGCAEKRVCSGRLGTPKGGREHARCQRGKVSSNLVGTL